MHCAAALDVWNTWLWFFCWNSTMLYNHKLKRYFGWNLLQMKTQLSVEGSRNHHLQMLILFKQTSNKHPTSYPISTTFTPYRFPLRFPLRFFGGRGSEDGRCLTTNKAIGSNIKGESTWHMGQKNSYRVHHCRGRTNHHFPYCGWFRNPVNSPVEVGWISHLFTRLWNIPGGCLGFLNHQQYYRVKSIHGWSTLGSFHIWIHSDLWNRLFVNTVDASEIRLTL